MSFALRPAPSRIRKARITRQDYHDLRRVAQQREPAMRKAIAASFAELRASINKEHLREAVHTQRVENIVRAVDFASFKQAFQPAIGVVNQTFVAGAGMAGRQLVTALKLPARRQKRAVQKADEVGYEIHFDLSNPFAEAWANANAAALVTAVDDQTRAAIQALTVRAFQQGIAPDDLAGIIEEMVGQNRPQAIAWMNYRAALLGQDLADARIDELLAAYRDRQIAQRAETIARHELLTASNQGQRILWRASAGAGLIPDEQQRVWITTPDDRLCDECEAMDGETTGIDEPWDTDDGPCDVPQDIHTDCRCAQGLTDLDAMQGFAADALDDPSDDLIDLMDLEGDDDGGDE